MKKISETIVFFGNERLATGVTTSAPTLRNLIEAGYTVAAVVSNFERGTSRSARSLEIAEVADEFGIPLLLPDKPMDIKEQLENYGASIGVLVAYGKIIPQSIIDIFPKGIVNIHPSLLPLHRGPTPIESVILDGSTTSGVSIMSLVKSMDAGPIYGQSEVTIDSQPTKQQLADLLLEIGSTMLIELLPGIIQGEIVAVPQDDSAATYDELLSKDAGIIDWEKPSLQLERQVRAYAQWPKSRTKLAGKDVIITRAHAVSSEQAGCKPGDVEAVTDAGIVMVCTASGSLCIERLKPAGKREMSAKEFLAGNTI